MISTYVLIILCELGDKTQLAVLILASNNPRYRWLVFGGAALALCCCVAVEVSIGSWLAAYIGVATINRITGVVFCLIGFFILGGILLNGLKGMGTVPKLFFREQPEQVK